jgi:hypothetical protein
MLKYLLAVIASVALLSNCVAGDITRTTRTDSSVIKTILLQHTDYRTGQITNYAKLIEEHYNGKNLVHEISFRDDTVTIQSDHYTDSTLHYLVGIAKNYKPDGKPDITVDCENGRWYPADTSDYPNYRLLNIMKLVGDSIVKSFFGADFFCKHIRWNMWRSNYFDARYTEEPSFAIEWLRDDMKNRGATEFSVNYDLIYNGQIHEEAVKIIFDFLGNILPSHAWNEHWTIYNHGLERFADKGDHDFKLTYAEAIQQARVHGLKEDSDRLISCNLHWEGNEKNITDPGVGHYRLYVNHRLGEKKIRKTGKHIVYFDVWVFNPWTKEFIKREKIQKTYIIDSLFSANKPVKQVKHH